MAELLWKRITELEGLLNASELQRASLEAEAQRLRLLGEGAHVAGWSSGRSADSEPAHGPAHGSGILPSVATQKWQLDEESATEAAVASGADGGEPAR